MVEMTEATREVGGIPLKPRKEASSKKKRTRKKSKAEAPLTEEEEKNAELSTEELARIAALLDPDNASTVTVTLDGEDREVHIYKCKARQIGHVMKFLSNAFRAMKVNTFKDAQEMAEGLNNPVMLVTALGDVADELFLTAALMTDLKHGEMEQLDLDDALTVALAVFRVNQRFFSERVMPMISLIAGRSGPGTSDSDTTTQSDTDINISME